MLEFKAKALYYSYPGLLSTKRSGYEIIILFPELLKLYFKSFAYPVIDRREEDEGRPEMLLERGLVPEYDGEQRKLK